MNNVRKKVVISREIIPLAAIYPPPSLPHTKKCFIGLLSVVAGGGMLIPTEFAPLSIVSVKKIWGGGWGVKRCQCLISRNIAKKNTLHPILSPTKPKH